MYQNIKHCLGWKITNNLRKNKNENSFHIKEESEGGGRKNMENFGFSMAFRVDHQ